MKRFAFIALLALAACATAAAPEGAPTARDIYAALHEQMREQIANPPPPGATIVNDVERIDNLSCRPAGDGCFQCSYTADVVRTFQEDGANIRLSEREPRADMVCNVTGSWTLTPMSQIGS